MTSTPSKLKQTTLDFSRHSTMSSPQPLTTTTLQGTSKVTPSSMAPTTKRTRRSPSVSSEIVDSEDERQARLRSASTSSLSATTASASAKGGGSTARLVPPPSAGTSAPAVKRNGQGFQGVVLPSRGGTAGGAGQVTKGSNAVIDLVSDDDAASDSDDDIEEFPTVSLASRLAPAPPPAALTRTSRSPQQPNSKRPRLDAAPSGSDSEQENDSDDLGSFAAPAGMSRSATGTSDAGASASARETPPSAPSPPPNHGGAAATKSNRPAVASNANGGGSSKDVKGKGKQRDPSPAAAGKQYTLHESLAAQQQLQQARIASSYGLTAEDSHRPSAWEISGGAALEQQRFNGAGGGLMGRPSSAKLPNKKAKPKAVDAWGVLGTLETHVTSLKAHKGWQTAATNQVVDLRRDSTSMYSHVVQVRHPDRGAQIGEVEKNVSKFLGAIMGDNKIVIHAALGKVPLNKLATTSVPLSLTIHGPQSLASDARLDFLFPARMAAKKTAREAQARAAQEAKELAQQRKREEDEKRRREIYGPNANREGKGIGIIPIVPGGSNAKMPTTEARERKTLDLFSELFSKGAADPALLPEHPHPPGRSNKHQSMRTNLLRFQSQGLAWMIKMEHPSLPLHEDDPACQLWSRKREGAYYNYATRRNQMTPPKVARGGILADEMGLGKTLQVIALIMTDDDGEDIIPIPETPDESFDDMTMIVCPLSVTSNWTQQLKTHVGSKRLKWHLYHGPGRDITRKQMREYDVIVTTYETLAGEFRELQANKDDGKPDLRAAHSLADSLTRKKQKLSSSSATSSKKPPPLYAIKWRRVVLDEGHTIRNPKAQKTKACAALPAERRWILTGTPIVNDAGDLGSAMAFLQMCKPLDEPELWKTFIETPIKRGDPAASQVLRAVVQSTTLRRTKLMIDSQTGKPLIDLPEIKVYLHRVPLDPAAREIYDRVMSVLQKRVRAILRHGPGSGGNKMGNMLRYLLRLRQVACDPLLLPEDFRQELTREEVAPNEGRDEFLKSRAPAKESSKRKEDDDDLTCHICAELPIDPLQATTCKHVFCRACIIEHLTHGTGCPHCLRDLDKDDLVEIKIAGDDDDAPLDIDLTSSAVAISAKTMELIKFLQASEEHTKSLVFSQWTSHLDLIEAALKRYKIDCFKFDGRLGQERREEVCRDFAKGKGGVKVMLISLKAGALGLNLTCASQVFLMDPWWQASIEKQAIDRVYRIGQQKEVRVFQIVAEHTVEDRVLAIQEKKDLLIKNAFATGTDNVKIESRLKDVAEIFNIRDDDPVAD